MFLITVSNTDIDFFKMLILKLSSKEAPWESSQAAAYFMPQRVNWLAARWALISGGGGGVVCRCCGWPGSRALRTGRGQLEEVRWPGSRAPRMGQSQLGEVRGGRCGSAFTLWPSALCFRVCVGPTWSVPGQGWAQGFRVWAWGWDGSLCRVCQTLTLVFLVLSFEDPLQGILQGEVCCR